MGSGKTTIGQAAADFYKVPFLDTDHEVARLEEMTIHDIFIDKGEYYFRDRECEVLLSTTGLGKAIIATGGGMPCHHDNMDWMLKNGITVYLQWPLDKLIHNLMDQREDRPLLSSLEKDKAEKYIEKLFLERKEFYEKAAITIEMSGDLEEDKNVLIKACNYIW